MIRTRREYVVKLRELKWNRHEQELARYLNVAAASTLSAFLPRRKKEEEVERLVRRLMLKHRMTFARAVKAVERGDILSDSRAHLKSKCERGRDGAYGDFCNNRSVRCQEETSDSDDDSVDDVLLVSRRPGRLLPIM